MSSRAAGERIPLSSHPLRTTGTSSKAPVGRLALVLDTLRSNRLSTAAWVIGGGTANVAMVAALKHEMDVFPGGPAALAASILPAAEAMRPLRWPAERLDTLGGYITYHNLTLFALLLALYGVLQGARAIRGGEENHSVEEVLATGWSRWDVVRDRALGFVVTVAAVCLGMGLGMAIGLAVAGEPDWTGALTSFVGIGLCMLVGYGVGLVISQLIASRRAAAGLGAVILTVLYVVENTWQNLGAFGVLRYLSPFHYANRSRTLVPGYDVDLAASATLLAMAAVLVLAGGWAFQHRDYATVLWRWAPREARRPSGRVRTWSVSRLMLRSAWSALVVRGRYGLLAWALAGAMFTGLMMFLEPPVMKVWSWFASYIPGGGGLTGLSAETQYVSFVTQIVVPFVAGYAITQASGWASDVAQGRVELVLSTPLTRWRLVGERLVALLVGVAGVALAALAALGVGAVAVGVPLQAAGMLRTLAGSLLLGAALGGVAALVVAVFPGTSAVTLMSLLLGASYLVGYLVPMFDWPSWLARVSVFTLFGNPYVAWQAAADIVVLAALAVLGGGAAMLVAGRTRSVA